MPILEHLWIIPLLPLLGATVNGLLGKNVAQQDRQCRGRRLHRIVVSGGAGSGARIFPAFARSRFPGCSNIFPGSRRENFRAGFDLQVDQLTVVMLLVVTGVGWLIHIYSTGYMAHEGGYYRFFSYLNLFMFFMLILVLAANYVLLFVGWEGVGLAATC